MSHSVRGHLGLAAEVYDREIRAFVPHYDELLTELCTALAPSVGRADSLVIDLGCGTGALSAAVAARFSNVRLAGWDVDTAMLAEAARRLAPFGTRVTLAERSFFDPLPPCAAVVASLALHHVRTLADKRAVYTTIHEGLDPGGVFLNADVTLSVVESVRRAAVERWVASMGEHGIEPERARAHLAAWAEEDRYFALGEELDALAGAGFAPECFWRKGPMTLYGGIKRARD